MQKHKVGFTLLILGSFSFTVATSLSDLHHHTSHLLSLLILHALILAYIWKPKFQLQTRRGAFAGLVFFSLFLFISSHVIPTGLLLDHHEGHAQTTEHEPSQHACCIPAIPSTGVVEIVDALQFIRETKHEPELLYSLRIIVQDTNRSPPQG